MGFNRQPEAPLENQQAKGHARQCLSNSINFSIHTWAQAYGERAKTPRVFIACGFQKRIPKTPKGILLAKQKMWFLGALLWTHNVHLLEDVKLQTSQGVGGHSRTDLRGKHNSKQSTWTNSRIMSGFEVPKQKNMCIHIFDKRKNMLSPFVVCLQAKWIHSFDMVAELLHIYVQAKYWTLVAYLLWFSMFCQETSLKILGYLGLIPSSLRGYWSF